MRVLQLIRATADGRRAPADRSVRPTEAMTGALPRRSGVLARPLVVGTAVIGLAGLVGIAGPDIAGASAAPSGAAAAGSAADLYQAGNSRYTGSWGWEPIALPADPTYIDEENYFGMAIVNGNVWAWGDNHKGELGQGNVTQPSSFTTPVEVPTLSNILQVDGGDFYGLARTSSGTVYSWGNPSAGELGRPTSNGSNSIPGQIPGLDNVVQISAGNNHSLALLSDGTVMTWGSPNSGDLGTGGTTQLSTPEPIPGLTDVVAVSAGCDWSMALLKNGTVMAWGLNNLGELGDGSDTNRSTPVQVRGLSNIVAISAGGDYPTDGHAVALDVHGNVWAWGDDHNGQLGEPVAGGSSDVPMQVQTLKHIVSVSAGGQASSAVDALGRLWIWGSDREGQLGTSTKKALDLPTETTFVSVVASWSGAEATLVLAEPAPLAGRAVRPRSVR
jgi:alpha-tubulin suppressor-like RCC1 family protein